MPAPPFPGPDTKVGWPSDASKLILGLGLLALVACVPVSPPPTEKPRARPAGLLPPQTGPVTPSAQSQALTRYYARVESTLLTQDMLRTGGGGLDTPYTDTNLQQNFERIAFYNEYQRNGGLRPSDGTQSRLKKWNEPVRFGVEFGPSVPDDQKERDLTNITNYAKRLSRITGHPITLSNRNPNFIVMFMSSDDGATASAIATRTMPSLTPENLVYFSQLPRHIQCFVVAAGYAENEYEYRVAIAYVRSETTELLRLSCIHEELAQGLGLANDSPRARPSIFNDDDEFALLTTHDEELLRLLYDPALKPGMTIAEARPIFQRLIATRNGPS